MSIQNVTQATPSFQPAVKLAGSGAKGAADTSSTPSSAAAQAATEAAIRQAAGKKASADQLKSTVESMNKSIQQSSSNLQFSIDASTERQVVKLMDSETGEIIRQFPSEQALAISKSIEQMQRGTLINAHA